MDHPKVQHKEGAISQGNAGLPTPPIFVCPGKRVILTRAHVWNPRLVPWHTTPSALAGSWQARRRGTNSPKGSRPFGSFGLGSKLNHSGPLVLVHVSIHPRFHFGYLFLTHNHFGQAWLWFDARVFSVRKTIGCLPVCVCVCVPLCLRPLPARFRINPPDPYTRWMMRFRLWGFTTGKPE